LYKKIITWIEEKQIIWRERKSNGQKSLGTFLYNAGLSYEKAGSFINASIENSHPKLTHFSSRNAIQLLIIWAVFQMEIAK